MIKQIGITLIELMIVVAIVGILAAIAYPSYAQYVMRSKRVTAEGDLYALRNAMQRGFPENNNSYVGATAAALNAFGAPVAALFPSQSPIDGGNPAYNLRIRVESASAYTLQAVPVGAQVDDSCGTLSLTSTNVRGVSSSTVANCWK